MLETGGWLHEVVQVYSKLHNAAGCLQSHAYMSCTVMIDTVLSNTTLTASLCRGAIKSKLYGKSKLYWPDQAQYGDISEADRSEWSSRAKELESTLGGLQAQRKALQSQLTALSSSLTGPALDAQLAATQVAVAGMRERLDRLQSSTAVVVTPEQRGAVKASLLRYRKGWSTRKAMVMDVIDNMAEGLEKKPAALMESVGLETDEEAGVSIKECLP